MTPDIKRESYTFHHVDVWNIQSLSVRSRSEEPAENTRSRSALLTGQNLKGTVVFIWPDVPYGRCVTVPHTNHEAAAETARLTHSYVFQTAETISAKRLAIAWARTHTVADFTTVRAAAFLRRLSYGGGRVGWRWCITTRCRMKNTCGATHLQSPRSRAAKMSFNMHASYFKRSPAKASNGCVCTVCSSASAE